MPLEAHAHETPRVAIAQRFLTAPECARLDDTAGHAEVGDLGLVTGQQISDQVPVATPGQRP